jgi:hypothetical protein
MTGTLILSSCEVSGNTASDYAGMWCLGGRMINCLIYNNRATGSRAGIVQIGTAIMEIINCTITSNEAGGGYGGIAEDGYSKIVNCILWGNTAVTFAEIYPASGADVTYSNVKGGYTGTGNVDIDPKFASVSDLHLSDSSPSSVYAGGTLEAAPSCDYDGNIRPHTAHPDNCSMGAYEKDVSL